MRIFVAEVSQVMRQHLALLFSRINGIEIVGQTQDAGDATRAIHELKPDVVTLDIQLVGGSGIDVLRSIKREAHGPIVIMVTNFTAAPFRQRCAEAGADFFLDKTKELRKVKEIVKDLAGPGDRFAVEHP